MSTGESNSDLLLANFAYAQVFFSVGMRLRITKVEKIKNMLLTNKGQIADVLAVFILEI
jgi:hypothetical protein